MGLRVTSVYLEILYGYRDVSVIPNLEDDGENSINQIYYISKIPVDM